MRLVLIAIYLSITCCNPTKVNPVGNYFAVQVNYDSCKQNSFLVYDTSVTRLIPKTLTDSSSVAEINCLEKYLGLRTLRNGIDSFEIRVWGNDSTHAFSDNERLIIVKSTNGKLSAQVLYFKYGTNQVNFQLDSLIGYKVDLRAPKSGWVQLLTQLEMLGLWKLPDFSDIEGYHLDTDEGGYQVELARKDWYKTYRYATPIYRVKEFPQAKKLIDIVDLLKREFELASISKEISN